jgi:transposase, IS5 family
MHIGADSQTKLIHSVMITAANVHDKHALPNLLHGQERRVYADAGYAGQQDMIHELAPEAKAFVNERAYGGKKLTDAAKGAQPQQVAHPGPGRARLRCHQGRVQVHEGSVPWPAQERHASVCRLRAGQPVHGARPFATHSMGVVRPQCGGRLPPHCETR